MNDLTALILDRITDPSVRLWWPGLAGRLVDDLSQKRGFDRRSYSTSAWITQGTVSSQRLFAMRNTRRIRTQAVVEVLPSSLQQRYEVPGCRFWKVDELEQGAALDLLASSLDEIAVVPELSDTVGQLAHRIHLLMPNDDAYDVNFSEPELPLSIFVSIPLQPLKHMRWRVAEAIVHEAGHLQLSLVERVVPLIASPQAQYYSPWRKAARSVNGVLHGLYVFGMIAEWMTRSSAPTSHVRQRLADINQEARQLADFPEASGLTDIGAALARSILMRISAAASSPVSSEPENEDTTPQESQ
ncbi:HEXXH motif-containing putative peptide modification protein [Cupriavidus sp. CV2]|uniref:aKG-HExxH-type peptide beta-hydroxylase n=1 Tax=Cupriavidus ulmosensis TaxID=3065913 RepID=UPI00296B3FB0|nr:HEXXH motif-containing putative peptide modification protein [Cupriavidus sp. CV2]MDW3681612.1 HEXXH motif-containing putative peptide modification protein [Cupriavidus sp. CV2]